MIRNQIFSGERLSRGRKCISIAELGSSKLSVEDCKLISEA